MALKSIVFDGRNSARRRSTSPLKKRSMPIHQKMTQHRLMCERVGTLSPVRCVLCPRLQRLEIRDCKIVRSNYLLEVLCKAAENDLLQSLSVVQLEGCERQAGYSMLKSLIQLPSLERVECDHAIFPAPAIMAVEGRHRRREGRGGGRR